MIQLKKHIALLSVLVLLLPTVVLTIHLFQNHEHTFCSSTNEHHFHAQELDCSLAHYQFNVFTYQTAEYFAVIPQHYYKLDYKTQPQLISFVYADKKSSRAPPCFTVS
ncbi:hypothetical protein [Tenacibaculum sediminilitoris]|uniref:hypothetical protein n=1 Tax=Tenacibaculum sediminilitoris TaxID=1820334 RepID=UPI0038B56BC2